jgi:hypothetical protein
MADQQGDRPAEPGEIVQPELTPPRPSALVRALGEAPRKPGDAIAIRGYLGPSDVFDRAVTYVGKLVDAENIPPEVKELAAEIQKQLTTDNIEKLRERASWRIYLSPNLDRYVEFNWQEDVVAYRPEADLGRGDAYTVWLRARGKDGAPMHYVVVQRTPLVPPATGYIGGTLIDDYLLQSDSESVVWDGQYGPITGRPTGRYCVG